jgi:hypothetical protein
VLELLEGVEIPQDRWAMPEAAVAGDEDGEESWAFDDLNDDHDDDDEEFCTPSPSSASSSDEHLISVQEYIR